VHSSHARRNGFLFDLSVFSFFFSSSRRGHELRQFALQFHLMTTSRWKNVSPIPSNSRRLYNKNKQPTFNNVVVVVMVLLGNHNERVLIVIQHSEMLFRACRLVRSDTRSLRSTFKEHDEASIVFDKRSGRQWPFISNTKTESKKKTLCSFPGRPSLSLHSLSPVGATYARLGVGSRLRVLYCVFSSCHCCIVLFDTL